MNAIEPTVLSGDVGSSGAVEVLAATNLFKAQVVTARVGWRGIDTIYQMTSSLAAKLKAGGVDFVVRYLGSLEAPEIAIILAAGLAVSPVIYAHKAGWTPSVTLATADGNSAVANAKAVNIEAGTTIWIDVEGVSTQVTNDVIISYINTVGNLLQNAGFVAGLYVGAGCPLTGAQLYKLFVTRYWKSQSKLLIDSTNQLVAEPNCGWVMTQMYPQQTLDGIPVDYSIVGSDYQNRAPTMMIAA